MARENYHHGDLKRTLVDAATELVRTKEVEGFSLRACARAAEVDPAAIYRHFSNKEALLMAVARRQFDGLAETMTTAMQAEGSAVDQFRATGRAYVHHAIAEPALFRLMFGRFGAGSSQPMPDGEGHKNAHQVVLACTEALKQAGLTPMDPYAASLYAWFTVHGLASLAIDGNLRTQAIDDLITMTLDRCVAALAAP